MTRRPIGRNLLAGFGLAAALALGACGETPAQTETPKELTFSILSAENQQSMRPLWL